MPAIWLQAILGIVIFLGAPCLSFSQAPERPLRGELLSYPGPWRFQWNARGGRAAFTTDDEFEQYVADGARGTGSFVQSLEALRTAGGDTMRIFFDYFYRQKTPGQEDAPRKYLPDSDAYIEKIAALSRVAQEYGVGFSLSFLSPLEIGPGYTAKTGETGVWLQYRKGLRDPKTGAFSVQMWRQSQWSNNKGVFRIRPGRVRVFAFQDTPILGTLYRVVDPASIVEIKDGIHTEVYEGLVVKNGDNWRHPPGASPHASSDDYHAQRIRVYGACPLPQEGLDRVVVVQELLTPEMDYFSKNALPFLTGLIDRYLAAGIKINGLYAERSAWVDYCGPVEERTVGVAIFDNPTNPRYPTYWHSRGYGLHAANIFGVHDFTGDKTQDGSLTIEPGSQLRFRYRVVIHSGDTASAKIAELYKEYAARK